MKRSARAGAAIAALALGAGLATTLFLSLTVAVVVVFLGLAIGACVSLHPLSRAVVVASFLTRARLPGPVPLLLEHCAALVALPAAIRQRSFRRAATSTPVILLAVFVAWNAAVSVLRAPDPGESLRIVVWLSLDLVIVIVILVAQHIGEDPVSFGVRIAGWMAVVALAIWLVGQAGFSDFGTQLDPLTGGRALYATAFEGNILGSLMAMWLFVLLSGERLRTRARMQWLSATLMLAVVLLSLARAAILGLLVGIVVWQVLLPASAARWRALTRLLALGAVGLVAVMTITPLEPVRTRLGQLTDLSSSTGLQRVENWKRALGDLDVSGVVTGLGTNSFGQRHLEPTLPSHPTPAYLGNLPLQVLYDSGVVGLLLLGGVFLSALPRPRRSRARSLGLFAVFLISSLATSSLWFATTWTFLARGAFLRSRTGDKGSITARGDAPVPNTRARRPGGVTTPGERLDFGVGEQ